MPNLKVYSANEVSFNFAGIPIDSGRGDAEFLTITKTEDTYKYKAGVDGEGTRSESRNTLHTVKLKVFRTSAGNAVLCAIHLGDIKLPGGAGIGPIMIRDRQGLSVFVAAEAWIKKMPEDTYAEEAGTIEWEFDVHDPSHFVGGN